MKVWQLTALFIRGYSDCGAKVIIAMQLMFTFTLPNLRINVFFRFDNDTQNLDINFVHETQRNIY